MPDLKAQKVDITGEFLTGIMEKYGERIRDISKEFAGEVHDPKGALDNESHALVTMLIMVLYFSDFYTGQMPGKEEMEKYFGNNFRQCLDAAIQVVADMNEQMHKTSDEEDADNNEQPAGPSVH